MRNKRKILVAMAKKKNHQNRLCNYKITPCLQKYKENKLIDSHGHHQNDQKEKAHKDQYETELQKSHNQMNKNIIQNEK